MRGAGDACPDCNAREDPRDPPKMPPGLTVILLDDKGPRNSAFMVRRGTRRRERGANPSAALAVDRAVGSSVQHRLGKDVRGELDPAPGIREQPGSRASIEACLYRVRFAPDSGHCSTLQRSDSQCQKETWHGLDQSGLAPENLTTLAHLSVVRRQLQHFACYTAVGKSKFIRNLRDATAWAFTWNTM
jgi:hypothetical protein